MASCKLCHVDYTQNPEPATLATGVCGECRTKLGIIPMPPPRRRARPCSQCNGSRFVRALPREFTATGGDFASAHAAPMTATVVPETSAKLFFSGRTVAAPTLKYGLGVLEMYICSGCGFVEWYCLDPESIPIGPEYMTEIVDHMPDSAYRG
jgi:hypothetical protein